MDGGYETYKDTVIFLLNDGSGFGAIYRKNEGQWEGCKFTDGEIRIYDSYSSYSEEDACAVAIELHGIENE